MALTLHIESWTMKLFVIVQIIIFSQILIFALVTRAEVNMKDASYQVTFQDFPEIQRSYNSRSIYTGYFGFGWCSNLEKSLNMPSPKDIRLIECGVESPFVLMDENNSLKTRIFENPLTSERLLFRSGKYYLSFSNGEIRIFNRKGQNTEIRLPTGHFLALEYKGDKLSKIKNTQGRVFNIFINDSDQIYRIADSSKNESIYLYEKTNLIQSLNSNKESHLYDYDHLNNLVKLTYPDKTEEVIVYNNENDRVVKVELRNKCLEYYDFYTANKDPLHQVSTLTRKCGNKTIHQYIYEFWYKTRDDGKKYLERYKINQPKQTLDITYLPYQSHPVRIIKNGKELISNI